MHLTRKRGFRSVINKNTVFTRDAMPVRQTGLRLAHKLNRFEENYRNN